MPVAAQPRDRATFARIGIALSAIYLIWGSTYLAIRFTVETIPPFLSAAARFLISGVVLFLWRRLAGDPNPTGVEWRNAAIIGIFLLVGGNGGVVWAAQFIPSSLAALLVTTVPLWMILFDAFRPRGERPGHSAVIGILIGFCGAVLLVGWTADYASVNNLRGAVVVLLASSLWATGSIYGKTSTLPASPLLTTSIEMMVGGGAQALVSFGFGELAHLDWTAVSQRSIYSLVYLTLVGPVAFISYAWLLRVAPIPLVATYSYVNPLVAIVLGYFLGKELITPRILLAAGLIVGSVVLVSRPKSAAEPDLIE